MSRTLRLILVILMLIPAFGIIPGIFYFLGAMFGKVSKGLRLILWILAMIPGLNIVGAIGLLLVELKIINVDSK